METLAVVATKGGVGKTTLAVHLAVAAQRDDLRVIILDLDPQASATQWGRDRVRLAKQHGAWFRSSLDVKAVAAIHLADALEQARREGFDVAIIDTPPHADYPAAKAVELADLVLIPTRPGYFDLHAAKATIALVQDMQARAFFVINQVPHTNLRIADDASAFLESKGLQRAPGVITALQPYVRALRDGLTAPELVPDGRHAHEIGALWAFVKQQAPRSERAKPSREVREPKLPQTSALDDPLVDLIAIIRGDAA